jgi:SNF2 family DNA or RNA helicase
VFTNLLDRLNLTIANCVYILEPQWNPMVEKQAIARVYRLGQTRNVKVVRYIVKGTVEEVSMRQKLRTSANVTNLVDAISTSEETGIR